MLVAQTMQVEPLISCSKGFIPLCPFHTTPPCSMSFTSLLSKIFSLDVACSMQFVCWPKIRSVYVNSSTGKVKHTKLCNLEVVILDYI